MASEILSTYIKKLGHPLKEIRERALQLLDAKLNLGWELEDELAGTRELLEALVAWFDAPQPSLQQQVLNLILRIVKTETGNYIARDFGIRKMLASLDRARCKMDAQEIKTLDDLMETLRFLNTIVSEDNVNIPPLALHSVGSSGSDGGSYYNLHHNVQTSEDNSSSNGEIDTNRGTKTQSTDGVKVLLFPWVELCSSDAKTMQLVEDALKLLKSTRRCCRFIRDVFLRDFPAEIFLNRPAIVQSLWSISDTGQSGRLGEALHVLLCITRALRARLRQLSSIDLINEINQVLVDPKESVDRINLALQDIAGDSPSSQPRDDLVALRQLPAPIYALDTLNVVMLIMCRSIPLNDSDSEILNMKDLSICVNLVDHLIELLLDCVSEHFWTIEHGAKTHRDIAQKSCMVMRSLGDLVIKYRSSFSANTDRSHHRVACLRLTSSAQRLLGWAADSAMPPTSLVLALQGAQLDPAIELMYPELAKKIGLVLLKSRTDQEHKSKWKELSKLSMSMDEAARFMKNKNSCRGSKHVLNCIQNSLPCLELHLSETYLNDISQILLGKLKDFDMNENDWSIARAIALSLMAHHVDWVRVKFYRVMAETVRKVLIGDETNQKNLEKSLTLLFDVGILTEICCHGISSASKEIETSAAEIMLYLMRGRLVLSEGCWWRLLASLLPVLPLLHVYAAHDTQLGQAICKSLEPDIAECMGVSLTNVTSGLVRLLFVTCPTVQLDAAHALCRLLDDPKYLPPRESLRTDVLINALKRIDPQDFNIDFASSPSKHPQTTGLIQILDVLKQDLVLDEHGSAMSRARPVLEPSMRRSTLQQLALMMRQLELHDTFVQHDGLKVVVATLRMSMMVEDYMAFPECAISCVSVLNSVCFGSRHTLAKIPDLPSLLLRVILVFPANDSAVMMSAQILALVAWSGFVLQELDASRRRVPALPLNVTHRTRLPFIVNSYWNKSPNAEHSTLEWLLSSEDYRSVVRMRWWLSLEGVPRVVSGAPPPPAPRALRPSPQDLDALRAASLTYSATKALLKLENSTSHKQVNEALNLLIDYTHLIPKSSVKTADFASLPWHHMYRFLAAPPASSRDTALLINLLQFVLAYMDNVSSDDGAMSWIKSSFIGDDASIISLLGREELYPQQTPQENIEVTQLHIHVIKVILRCVRLLEYDDNYDSHQLESLVKILFVCLERIDLKNFHMLGFLNELVRCIRYALNSRYCKLSEETLVTCMKIMTSILSGSASGGGRKGQACRLDSTISLLALLQQAHIEAIPVQRWSEAWAGGAVPALAQCARGARPELRAAALHAMTALAQHAQLLTQLECALSEGSLVQLAAGIVSDVREANVVRTAATHLLVAVTARISPYTVAWEDDVLRQLQDHNFLEICIDIIVNFCNRKHYQTCIEPNVPLSLLERCNELEVRAQKCGDVRISPTTVSFYGRPPPTAGFVAAIADLAYNLNHFKNFAVEAWDERGLYRLLFRCTHWSQGDPVEAQKARASACRALAVACNHRCVRATLAATKDCLHNLLATLVPFDYDSVDYTTLSARTQSLQLIASLLLEKSAADSIWRDLREKFSLSFFKSLVQCLDTDDPALLDASLYCLTMLAKSTANKKHLDKSKDDSRIELLDNLKSPFIGDFNTQQYGGGDSVRDCQPDYLAEELCRALILLYEKQAIETKFLSQVDQWTRLCSCLSSLLSASVRGRHYCVHRQLPRALLVALRAVRDKRALYANLEGIKNASGNPTLRALCWLLTVINCQMLDCPPAKESFAEEDLALSLNHLWPWCMLTDQLREAVMRLLLAYSNDCPKAWASMSVCVSGRSLVGEVCTLTCREVTLQSKPRSEELLLLCLRTLQHTMGHHHCRAIIIKSEVVSTVYRWCVRERGAGAAGLCWARGVEALARHADGAPALLALRPLLVAPALRAALLPALAHAARHRRAAVLQATDLLELLSGTLLAGDTAEVVSAARAVWALAANNHKAKLQLRSAGITGAVQAALQRVRRYPSDVACQRALQLLIYTNSVLQTT